MTDRILLQRQLEALGLVEFNQDLVLSMTEGILVEDRDGRFTFLNPAAEAFLGYPPGELLGKHWTTIIPKDQQAVVDEANSRRQRGKADRYEVQVVRKDGQRLHVLASGSPRYANGKFDGTLAILTDISERKKAEEIVLRQAESLRLVNSLNNAINRGESLGELISLLVAETKKIFNCDGASVYLYNKEIDELTLQNISLPPAILQKVERLIGRPLPTLRFSPNDITLYRRMFRKQESLLVNEPQEIRQLFLDTATSSRLQEEAWRKPVMKILPQLIDVLGINSIMVVPLLSSDGIVGMLDISRRERFGEEDLERFAAIASQLTAILSRKQAEDALRDSENRYRTLFENAPIGLGISERQGRLIDFNDAMLNPGGYSREDFLALDNVGGLYLHPEDRQRALKLAEEQGFLHRYEVKFRRKDGSAYDALLSLTPIASAGKSYWQVMVEDLSDRKETEEWLRLQSMALDSAANGMLIADRDSRILWANAALCELTGYDLEEIQEMSPTFLRSGFQEEAAYQALWETIRSGEVWHGEFSHRRKDGVLYVAEQTITPVASPEGEISHFIAIQQDVTERRSVEIETQRQNRELALLNRVIAEATTTLEPEILLETVCRELAQAFEIPQAGAALLRADGTGLVVTAEYKAEGMPSALQAEIPIAGNPATEFVLRNKKPLMVEDAQGDPRLEPVHELIRKRGVASILLLPLVFQEQVLGTLGLDSFEPRQFSKEEINLGMTVASTAAQVVQTARLFKETQRRAEELEAVADVSSVMRTAESRSDMYPIILNQLLYLLEADGAVLALRDLATDETRVALARGAWAKLTGKRYPAGEGVLGGVIATGGPYVEKDLQPLSGDQAPGDLQSVVCIPMIAQERAIGAIMVGRSEAFLEDELNILQAICDMAANAIHRASLFEQTERRVQRLAALRIIDEAITASVDLQLTLNILLEQVSNQLNVDAATVLLLSPQTQMLEFAARQGFKTGPLRHTRLRLGEGLPGKAALERRIVHTANLTETSSDSKRATLLAREGFTTYYAIPLIAKGQVKGVLEIFNRQPLAADPEWLEFLETLAGQAAIAIDNVGLFDSLQRSNVELALAYDTTIEGWARALELRDMETEGHSQRVTEMTLALAAYFGLRDDQLVHVRHGALLHDIGKMGVPDDILRKPGPLTDEEWEKMRQHPVYAYELLQPISYLKSALDIPYCHHEKWDGSGYPRGLKGEQIPLAARIFAVVDVWDALLSDRPYRPAWTREKALSYIRDQSGAHFDPQVVEAFLSMV